MQNNYYNQIKDILTYNEVYKKVKDYSKNRNDLESYLSVGKLLIEAQGGEKRAKYGNQLIKEYSKRLTNELGRKYDYTSLSRMRQFYVLFKNIAPLAQQLTWSHYQELLPLKDINKINYYINQCITHKLSKRQLREKIKSKEYERLPESTKNKLIAKEETNIKDFVKNPIVIDTDKKIINEKALKLAILDNIEDFLYELGDGFSFIGSEYKIKLGNEYNYIDLLLFNYIYNCFVVIELKVTELKKEHIGQIETYMNYIDKNLKNINQDKTIGIIICKKDNHFIMEYVSDKRILSREYITL